MTQPIYPGNPYNPIFPYPGGQRPTQPIKVEPPKYTKKDLMPIASIYSEEMDQAWRKLQLEVVRAKLRYYKNELKSEFPVEKEEQLEEIEKLLRDKALTPRIQAVHFTVGDALATEWSVWFGDVKKHQKELEEIQKKYEGEFEGVYAYMLSPSNDNMAAKFIRSISEMKVIKKVFNDTHLAEYIKQYGMPMVKITFFTGAVYKGAIPFVVSLIFVAFEDDRERERIAGIEKKEDFEAEIKKYIVSRAKEKGINFDILNNEIKKLFSDENPALDVDELAVKYEKKLVDEIYDIYLRRAYKQFLDDNVDKVLEIGPEAIKKITKNLQEQAEREIQMRRKDLKPGEDEFVMYAWIKNFFSSLFNKNNTKEEEVKNNPNADKQEDDLDAVIFPEDEGYKLENPRLFDPSYYLE